MKQRQTIIVSILVICAFGIGLIVGRGFSPTSTVDAGASGQDFVSIDRRADDGGQTPRRSFQNRRADSAPRPVEESQEGFAYLRLVLNTAESQPKACFQFTEPLIQNGEVDYSDYIRVRSVQDLGVQVNGASLCILGLDFDKDYRVRLRAGLPSAEGGELKNMEEIVVAFGDKPAYVGFSGAGVILPRVEADGIGIETVNVDQVDISVRRVSDRALSRKSLVAGDSVSERDYFYVWNEEDGEDVGVEVWKSKISTVGERNETQTTVFSLGAALESLKPGAYFIHISDASAGAGERRKAQSWRWVMFTDMALTTYSGVDGIDLFVRSIATARPLAGVELALIAANNEVLATATTNADGRAKFGAAIVSGKHPLTPRMVMAYGPQQDFALLDLRRAPLDLSDRGIAGRATNPILDAYVYLDRGIYRPGEVLHASGLLRAGAVVSSDDRPINVTIRRPNYTRCAGNSHLGF